MTKGERDDLRRHIKRRETVLKSAAAQRSAELLADFEQQVASIYSFDQDEVWSQAYRAAREAAHEAEQSIARRCAEIGIPEKFAPSLELIWHGRGQNAVKQRQEELRRVAKRRIEAIEKKACTQIEHQIYALENQVLCLGLSKEAKDILDTMPALDQMMPALDLAEIEGMLEARNVGSRAMLT